MFGLTQEKASRIFGNDGFYVKKYSQNIPYTKAFKIVKNI